MTHPFKLTPQDAVSMTRPTTTDEHCIYTSKQRCRGHTSHNQGILYQTDPSSYPVTLDADPNLSDNNTDDLEIIDRGHPVRVADLVVRPALRPDRLVQGRKVTNREQAVNKLDPRKVGEKTYVYPSVKSPKPVITYRLQYAVKGERGSFLNIVHIWDSSREVSWLDWALIHFCLSEKGRSACG